jgi:hypothetical protein
MTRASRRPDAVNDAYRAMATLPPKETELRDRPEVVTEITARTRTAVSFGGAESGRTSA